MTDLRTEPVFDALKQPLALIESDERRRGIETYIEAARTPLERAVFDLMSQMAAAIEQQLGEGYRIRLNYQPGGLQVEAEAGNAQVSDEQAFSTAEGDVEKITIRIPAELKDLAQQAAGKAGTSANTWFVKALARAVRNIDVQSGPPPPPSSWRSARRHDDDHGDIRPPRSKDRGSRISGWVGGDDDT